MEVKEQVLVCNYCELASQCRSPIPLATPSNPDDATFIVLGEAPGRVEDQKGVPFTGPAGMLLRRTLSKVGLDPDAAAYMNVASCWPHGTPNNHHIDACRGNLKAQLDVVRAKHVLVTGTTALETLIPHAQFKYVNGLSIPIHGKFVYTVRHPAYVLRQDREAMNQYQIKLQVFAMIVQNKLEPENEFCMYCDRYREAYAPTCWKHLGTFRKDAMWRYPQPQQQILDL
jgi:uracil-DNA glycosylase